MSPAEKKERAMTRILCPIRGGPQSQKAVDLAIELSISKNAKLMFLYIVDVDFLEHATVARVNLMVAELKETGHFALSILCDKARARGVDEVVAIIREGDIFEVILSVAEESQVSHLVIGRPIRTPGIKSFSDKQFNKFLKSIEEASGLNIECVE
ncbi:MAG: universal stress protein [Deltaproteobacteria bacterium]|nr:universal stress protein [Deltaproteobacteria bacterium]